MKNICKVIRRIQYSFESMSECKQCGIKFGSFSKAEKYCTGCKHDRQVDSKRRHRMGYGIHDIKEYPVYHAYNEIIRDAYFRIDNDPNNIFTGSYFRKIDIMGGVKDGWLKRATITHVKTGKRMFAENLK